MIGPLDPMGVAARVAAFGLEGDDRPVVTVEDEAWERTSIVLSGHRLTGLALAAMEGGRLRLSEDAAADLLERHRGSMLLALAMERELVRLHDELDRSGVETIVLKGPAVAHTRYPDPSWRPFGDLDLLVRGSAWSRGRGVLEAAGFHRELPEPRPGFDRRFGKAATHVREDGLQVDLHRTLVLGPFGLWLEPEVLFERTAGFALAGRTFRRLDDTALLLHACMHASLGWSPALLLPLRDVVQAARFGEVDWEDLADLARRWRLRAVVRHAFRTARRDLGVALPARADALVRWEISRTEERALSMYLDRRRALGGTALGTLRAIPGVGAKGAYLRALLFPTREFLQARARAGAGEGDVNGDGATYRARWSVPVRWLASRR